MSSITATRLPEEHKARVAAAAERAGTAAHRFILEAIAKKEEDAERRSDFHAAAEQRYAEIVASGKAIAWAEMRAYLKGNMAGKKPRRPVASKLARG